MWEGANHWGNLDKQDTHANLFFIICFLFLANSIFTNYNSKSLSFPNEYCRKKRSETVLHEKVIYFMLDHEN